jgi:cyclopropane-fatty-acyl-phospholipid synthase
VRALYDERFCRMWEFYLQLCEIGYRRLNWMVFQAQIAKRLTTVPLTRTYLAGAMPTPTVTPPSARVPSWEAF